MARQEIARLVPGRNDKDRTDETDDDQSRFVEVMAAETIRLGMGGRVTASHTTAMHSYNNAYCGLNLATCQSAVTSVAAQVPVINGELGENDCAHGFIDGYLTWADGVGISYGGWTWNTWSCTGGR